MASSLNSTISRTLCFDELLQKLDNLIDTLTDQPLPENRVFNRDEFWKLFITTLTLLTHEASKICLAFNGFPLPSSDESRVLGDNILNSVENVLNIFYTFPLSEGLTVYSKLHDFVESVVKSVRKLCQAIATQNNQLITVGDVWEKCDVINKLPKDNKEAALIIFNDELDLVDDALLELSQAIENGAVEEQRISNMPRQNGLRIEHPNWSESDLEMAYPCLALIKAYKSCLKKTSKAISTGGNSLNSQSIKDFDMIIKIIQSSSSSIDDLVLSLYPPNDPVAMRENVIIVRNLCKELLDSVRSTHFVGENDKTWIDFLQHAAEHNYNRAINGLVQ